MLWRGGFAKRPTYCEVHRIFLSVRRNHAAARLNVVVGTANDWKAFRDGWTFLRPSTAQKTVQLWLAEECVALLAYTFVIHLCLWVGYQARSVGLCSTGLCSAAHVGAGCERLAHVGIKHVRDASAPYSAVKPKPQAATSSYLVDTPSGRVTCAQDERRWRALVFLARVADGKSV